MTLARTIVIAAALGAGLCGCVESQEHLSPGFGAAVRQDVVAQITDPEAGHRRTPPPPSNGERAEIAQERYRFDEPIQPTGSASKIGASVGAAPAATPMTAPSGP